MEPFILATVLWYDKKKGFGFAHSEEIGKDVMIHQSVIEKEGFRFLEEGERIMILGLDNTPKGLRALSVKSI